MIYEMVGIAPSDFAKNDASAPALTTAQQAPQAPMTSAISGSAASIRKSADGHFWTTARVNSSTVKFLVDTGASVVALTPSDARRAGFRPGDLTYSSPVNTAGGQVMGAAVKLDFVSVSNVRVRNVRALVIPEGLEQSLLGMSYLGELQKVEASRDTLILRQ